MQDHKKGDLIARHGGRSVSFCLNNAVSVCIFMNALNKRKGPGEKEEWIKEASGCRKGDFDGVIADQCHIVLIRSWHHFPTFFSR